MNRSMIRPLRSVAALLLQLLLLASLPFASEAATTTVTCVNPGDLQAAINAAAPFDTLKVSGICSETELTIRSDKNGLVLDGGGSAIIQDPEPGGTAITVRGAHQVRIRNFANITSSTISGTGVFVVDGGAAQVLNNTISGNADGVAIQRNSEAIVNNNTIVNNVETGIRVAETSSSRIGLDFPTFEPAAAPNTIQGNGSGIWVLQGSSARIIGNDISHNAQAGILVQKGSHADVASNTIQGNVNGIEVRQNSSVVLGEDTGSGPLNDPNSGRNVGFGVLCGLNSSIDGRRGALDGTIWKVKVQAGCIDDTRP